MVDGPGRLEYREALCLDHTETIWGWPIKVDLSNFGTGGLNALTKSG